ncbi:DNA-dependent protein kinase catalytic subunit-like [Sitodiplosis mosellana]|uniref:DNA-dependent protein kinase catalytic subunit-like n=1 Tax=Sitodiplosis mosellana TaxID=263140 RepID=UPI0024447A9E|nr:DNA-dependent protein kinase catalytic subunit-like [Sitodiplosis mosellana]
MSSDVILYCEQLKAVVGSQDTKKASTNLDAIDQYFNDRISENEIDLAVAKVLSDDGGVLGFVKLCLKQSKTFKDETIKSFELFVKVIELYPKKVAAYATDVVINCLQYVRSMQTSAREKDKAGAVIEALVLKNCCDSIDRIYLMSELLKIAQLSKPGIVQCRIFGLIGCLAKDYPDCIENAAEDGLKIRDMYFKVLENAVINKQDTSFVSLAGAFNGLSDFLEHFAPSEVHKAIFAERVYKCIKPIAKPLETSQKAVHRSALNLLASRCELFGKQVFEDFFYWHDLLVNTWLKMDQFDNRRPAICLLRAMHREIANQLVQSDDPDRCREILTFLQSYFKTTLESSSSQTYEVRLAIVGFGLIAAPCKRLMTPEHLNELLRLVMQRTESAANAVNQNSKEQLEHFPDYVEALSRIMEQINQLSGIQLNVLQNIIVSVIRNFHLLSAAHHEMTINTLMRTFHNLSELGDSIVDDILEKVVLQGVIWTCSHKLPFDAKNDWSVDTDWKDQVTYVSYLPLWNGFLAEVSSTSYDRNAVVSKIYDQMMQALFKILDKLNLSVNKRVYRDEQGRDQELFFSDPNYDFEPVRVKDFHIFFNLVGFYHDVLKAQSLNSHKTHFLKWINRFVEEVISKSLKHPLVSGFVRLAQLILGIANRLDYFGNELYEDSQINYNDVYYYLSTTIRKAQQSSGELQIACLKLLFSAPSCMLCTLIHDMTPAFQLAFEIGKSNASLFIAGMALSAIERYLAPISRMSEEAKQFLRDVLPYFDAFLQGFKNDSVKSVEISRHRIQGTKRTAQKLIKVKENDLLKFQKRIILFLGTLEPEYCLYVMQNNENATLVKWNKTPRVSLKLYGPNFNPEIHMDTLIPRICEIASSTTDRQKKMTACEIIQATILYLIGSDNHEDELWSKLCKLMLELGCDGDVGVQQMFEPLVMQTMHYLSKRNQLPTAGTQILLTCLFDAISHPSNLSVRDLASRSLREFLSWAFRQTNKDQVNASPFKVANLLQKLKLFNSDALHQKRFGAALAFNNIYRVLREEDAVVNIYWLDLLHDFCVNFKLSEQQSEQNVHCQTDLKQVSASLDHILRVLREHKHVFNKPDVNRAKPEAFADSLLLHAVLWLLGQCNSTQHMYRQKVMEMFTALAPCVDGYNSSAAFIRSTQTDDASVVALCENGLDIEHFEARSFAAMYVRLKRLHTTLDCYIWFIENNFMPNWKPILNQGCIFAVLEHYMNNIMNRNFFEGERDMGYELILEKDRINAEKSAILLLIFQFLNKTMPIGCAPDVIWQTQELIWVIETSVFRPQFLECDTKNPEFLSKLPKSLESFISFTNRFASAQFKSDLNNKLVRSTTDIYETLTNSIEEILNRSSISTSDANNLKGVDLMCSLFRTKHVFLEESLRANIDVLASKVLYQVFEGVKECQGSELIAKTPSPDTLKFASHLLEVCLYKEGIYINLIDLLLNTTDLKLYNSMKAIKHGKHFLNLFKSTIYKYFLKQIEIVTERLISKILPPNVAYVLNMLIELTDNAYKAGSQNLPQMKSLTNIVLGKWSEILTRADRHIGITTNLIELMGQVAMICPYELTEISKKASNLEKWLLNLIVSDDYSIETKIQAIFLLPCLIGPATYEHQEVQSALEKFQTKYFPLYTSELRPGSVDRTTFENAFQVILDTMCASKSLVMLKFIINCTVQDSDHIMDQKIVQSVQKFITSLKAEHQLNCLNNVFEMFNSISFDSTIRTALMKRFLSHMILSSDKETITQFYTLHIRKIEQLLETPYGLHQSDYKLEQAFTSRIGGFQLLEILVVIFAYNEIIDKKFPVLIAKMGGAHKIQRGNELLAWMSKASATKLETFQTTNAKHMEWFRKYQCAAFKSLCALISNTKSELKFYDSWIFQEKNWWNIININDNNLYTNQTLEVDKRPQIKERMVSIRRLKQNTTDTAPGRKYIESQNVFESSLSQDVTKIDLSSSYVRTTEEVEHQNRIANYQPKTLMLEKNSVNDHEVMATICAVIEHMFEESVTPINADGTVRRQKLPWIDTICNPIANKSNNVHINIRIFLVTVVDNCSKWFRNYADAMTPAILKFLLDWTTANRSIDALTIFCLVDILEWDSAYRITKNSAVEEQDLASALMANLMAFAHSPQREVFRRNLELIRNLMERWRDFIKLPHQLLYEKISDENVESKSNAFGLHLNGIVLANELVPWTEESKKPFLQAIRACLNNHHTDVYQPAAQVLGMALHETIVKQNNGDVDQETAEFINELVMHLKGWQRANEKKFMYVIFYIDKYYVIKEFITSIGSLIATSPSDMKKFYLQMFLARVNEADSRDVEVILLDLLTQSQEHQHQLIGLHIFNKALPKMSVTQIKHILPRVVSFQDAKQTETRDVVYEIMKYIRENHSRADEELNRQSTDILLKGLNDVDTDLQNAVFKYWNELPELPAALNDRILFMFQHLYSHDFLKYGVQLLIDLKSNDLKNRILSTRADDGKEKYTEYDINVNWKSQDSSLRVPLFTESQQKQIINSGIDATQSYLRATQHTLHFDPTLDPSSLHQSSKSFSLQSQSSLLIGGPTQVLDRRSQQVQPEETVSRTRFSYLRERILRNKDAAGREKALSAVRRREYQKREQNQQQQRKEGQVTLYRRYRFGDFPDFFINSLAFLLPLQVLVKLDPILARNTFVAILNAVYHRLKEDQMQTFLNGLSETIASIIRQPNNCDPMLFSALTEIILTNEAKVRIDAGIVTAIPNANDMMINAILLLENQINTVDDEANGETWAELANMYYSLSEYDVAASIFSDKMTTDKLLTKAIEFESNGDYERALQSYMKLINKSTDDSLWNKHVADFAYQSLFNCYEEMGRWEDLENNVIGQLSDEDDSQQIQFEQLWTDEWNSKYILPHYIRSEVHTLLYTFSQSTEPFIANIEQWLRNPTRADFIKKHFGEQLMILSMANTKYLEAKVFSNQYFEGFLDDWSAMSVLSEKMRSNKLMNTRRVAEMHKYADLLTNTIDDSIIAELADRWYQTQMNTADSTQMWEALVSYRNFVTKHALNKFYPNTAPVVDRLKESMFDMRFKLNEIAVQQQNYGLSNIVLRRLNSDRSTLRSERNTIQFELSTVKQEQNKWMSQSKSDPKVAFDNLVNIWTNLWGVQNGRRNILDANPDLRLKVLGQLNEITDQANEIVTKCDTIDDAMKQKVAQLTGAWDDSQSMSQLIGTYARRCCNETIALAEKCEESRAQAYSSNFSMKEHDIGESYYRLAIFCLRQLKSDTQENRLETTKLLIKSILRGMRHDSKNARLQFPRLLQLPNIDSPVLTDLFNGEVNDVPLWIFLGWTTQIVSRFNFKHECFLDNLLLRLATTYPSTVIYTFQLAYRQYYAEKPNAPIRPVVQQMVNAVKNPMIERFIENVNYLSLPDKVMAYHLHNVIEKIYAKTVYELVREELQTCYDNVYGEVRGKSAKKVESFKQEFIALMKMDDVTKVKQGAVILLKKVKDMNHKEDDDDLNHFSPYLAQYHWTGGDNFIELPGQHTGNVAPTPSNTLKIVKFHEKVTVYKSLRRPIKMNFDCDDGKSYSFLVKYGEDLRLDDHVQQIQKLMSDQMKADKNCSQQKLSIRTYKVIPLTVHCGLISWVENTETIKSLLSQSDPNWDAINGVAVREFRQFIHKFHNDSYKNPNIATVLNYKPDNIAWNLKKLQQNIPENGLRKAIYKLSASPECFYALRNNFVKSLAAMSIAHWVLGIGDRHLDNFVIDLRNAQLIGIDFNMAFGAATRRLEVPELVPFRLTNQFANVMKPLGTSGFLIKCMAHVLRMFRLESESLMAALEAFICGPSSSENDFFIRGATSDEAIVDSASSDFRACKPEQHISTIKDKLSGINPVIPTENDLQVGFYCCDADITSKYKKLLIGTPDRFRYKLAKRNLTVKEQVECLIDIASDPAILGASFEGTRPWV